MPAVGLSTGSALMVLLLLLLVALVLLSMRRDNAAARNISHRAWCATWQQSETEKALAHHQQQAKYDLDVPVST